jgi:hypothetical protein
VDKKLSYRILLGLSTSLALLPVIARADFIIEFMDGRQVTVSRYVDEGQTIKIYTPQGMLGFRKADVKRITEASANQGTNVPLDSVTAWPSSPTQAPVSGSSDGKETAKGSDKGKAAEKPKTAKASKLTDADLERMDEQYQDVSQQYSEIWKKHVQDFRSGAADEVLTENRKKLLELDQQRKALQKEAHKADPQDVPRWAQ